MGGNKLSKQDPNAGAVVNRQASPQVDPTVNPPVHHQASPQVDPTVNPPVNHQASLQASPTVNPPMDHQASPQVDPTMNPPVHHQASPQVDPTVNPPVNHQASPQASPTVNPPMDHQASPQMDPTVNPPMNHQASPQVGLTVNPPVNRQASPQVDPTVNPPVDHQASPQVDPTVNPPVDHRASPQVSPTVNPPMNHQASLQVGPTVNSPMNHQASPQVSPTVNPPVNRQASPQVDPTVNRQASPQGGPTVNPPVNHQASPQVSPTVNPPVNHQASPQVDPSVNPPVNRQASPQVSPTVNLPVNRQASPQVSPTMNLPVNHQASPQMSPTVNPPVNCQASSQVGPTVNPPMDCQASPQVGPTVTGLANQVPSLQLSAESGDTKVKSKFESPEYKAFRKHFHDLAVGISDPTMLGSELYSAELINLEIRLKLLVPALSIPEKNQVLLSAVEQQVLSNPSATFSTFLEVLASESSRKDLTDKLSKTYSKMISLSAPKSTAGAGVCRDGASNGAQLEALQHSSSKPPSWTWDPTLHGGTDQTGETRSPGLHSLRSPTPLDEYAEYLRAFYSQMEMPCAISNWPQVPLQKYINLAVVRTDQLTPAESCEFTKATIHGCIDDIREKKEPIKLCDILKPDGKHPIKRVLIEGAPGIGKSTLAWKVCRKWGKHKLFQQYRLVVLLRLRDKRIQDSCDVADLFYYPDPDVQSEIVKRIRRNYGQGLLLIFEGYDELPIPIRKSDSVFHRIFTGRDLTHATVIITTRPTASTELRSICAGKASRRIEVLGFGKTEVNEYIQSSFPNKESMADFEQYLYFHPHIHKMMYVPLNCAIVVEVYLSSKRSKAPAPKTITHLYSALIIALLQRYLNNCEVYQHEHTVLHDFNDLPQPVYSLFLQMCQLAYSGIIEPETVLIFRDLPEGFDSLGLMQSVNELYVSPSHYGVCSSHNFLHLTIQEYLAAFHIARWSMHEQVAFLKKYIRNTKMLTMLAFLTGLTKTGKQFWDAVQLFSQHQRMGAVCLETTHCIKLPVLQWLFESQDPVACDCVLGSTGPVGFRYDGSALPFDFFILGYCIVNGRCGWDLQIRHPTGTEWVEMLLKGLSCQIGASSSSRARGLQGLDISHCELPSEVFEFLKSIPIFLQNLTHLIFYDIMFTSDGLNLLAELLGLLPNLQRFVVWHTPLAHGGAVKAVRCLATLSNLREVVIKDAGIGLEECKALCDLLRMSRSITLLDMGDNPFLHVPQNTSSLVLDGIAQSKSLVAVAFPELVLTSQDTECLAAILNTNTTLRKLCISYCKMALHDAIYLTKSLKTAAVLKQLHSLYMAGCNIQDEAATSLAEAVLSKDSVVEVLDLSENSIGVEGASAIAEKLCENTCLKELYLANNQFGSKGALCIANALERNKKIEILKLSRNSFLPAGNIFKRFTDSIAECTTLHSLYLDYCDIQTEDVVYLAKSLERNSTLIVVSLSGNPVGVRGAVSFAKTLRRNETLLELWLDDKSIGTEGARILIDSLCSTATVLYLSDACKPEHFDHMQNVTFLQYMDKHLIPPIAPLLTTNRYYFT